MGVESFQYAEEHNVLLVHCSEIMVLMLMRILITQDDVYDGSKKYAIINVGSISSKLDSSFVSLFPIMVSKMWIYLHLVKKSILLRQGILMLILALHLLAQWFRGLLLIWSYYPKLTAQEVKQIILDSGTAYDIEVLVPGGEGTVKFSELSKSGKVLNVYDAMELAKK
jgi:hypothetical protein